MELPNTPHSTAPIGNDASANVSVSSGGRTPEFHFEPRNHVDLAENLGLIDFSRSAKLSGSGFWLHFGLSARLQRALSNWMLDLQTREHGYTEVYPPALVRGSALVGTGQLPKFADDQYRIEGEDLWLIPTAEVPLTNVYADEIVAEEALPLKFAALTPLFSARGRRRRDRNARPFAGAPVRQGRAGKDYESRDRLRRARGNR